MNVAPRDAFFEIFILAVGCTRTLSCRGRRLDDPHGRGEHCSPAKILKETFLFSYFCVTKSTKSQQGGLAPSSFRTTGGVHEFVVRAVRGECVRQRDNAKVGDFAALRNLILPRVRTKCTKKPSRFVHALSARPLKKGGAGVNLICAPTG